MDFGQNDKNFKEHLKLASLEGHTPAPVDINEMYSKVFSTEGGKVEIEGNEGISEVVSAHSDNAALLVTLIYFYLGFDYFCI